jgi:hypothetical protein
MTEEELLELNGEESTEQDIENLSGGGYRKHSKPSKEVEVDEEVEEPEIEVVKDTKKKWSKDPMEVVGEDDDDDYSKSVKKRIGKLRASATELARQRDQEAQEKNELLAFAKAQSERLASLEAQLSNNLSKSIKTQEDSLTQLAKSAQAEYKQALLTGNADQIAEAHEKLTEVKVNLAQLRLQSENRTIEIENQKKLTEHNAKQVQQNHQVQAPVVPASRVNWFQKNPWFNPSGADEKSAYAITLDRKLQAEGVEADSDEYFEAIDKGMRAKFPSAFGVKRSSVTAPTVRHPSIGSETGPIRGNKIVLTQSQMNTAKKLGLTTTAQLKRYAIEISKGTK